MIFIDASALVAMIALEPEAEALFGQLVLFDQRMTSAIAIYETVLAVNRLLPLGFDEARETVHRFCNQNSITLLPVTTADGDAALSAFARFGKGSGHAARLNMGDCFAYGMAERLSARLLFKGDDFAATPLGVSVET